MIHLSIYLSNLPNFRPAYSINSIVSFAHQTVTCFGENKHRTTFFACSNASVWVAQESQQATFGGSEVWDHDYSQQARNRFTKKKSGKKSGKNSECSSSSGRSNIGLPTLGIHPAACHQVFSSTCRALMSCCYAPRPCCPAILAGKKCFSSRSLPWCWRGALLRNSVCLLRTILSP